MRVSPSMPKNPTRVVGTAWSVLSSSPRSKWHVDYLVMQRVVAKNSIFVLPVQSDEAEKLLSFVKGRDVCVCLGGRWKKLLALLSELATGTIFACNFLASSWAVIATTSCRILAEYRRKKTSCCGLVCHLLGSWILRAAVVLLPKEDMPKHISAASGKDKKYAEREERQSKVGQFGL